MPSLAHSDRTTGMVERYREKHPRVSELIRRGYSAERIAELAGVEVWIVKLIKFSNRW